MGALCGSHSPHGPKDAPVDRPSKFLVVCLNAIRDAVAPEDGGGSIHGAGDWGVELWRCCCAPAPTDVLDTSGSCATLEQTAWLVSTACDIVARKERLGMVVSCPFLLYIVPSQEKAAQVSVSILLFLLSCMLFVLSVIEQNGKCQMGMV